MKDKNPSNVEQILFFFNNVSEFQEIVDQIKDDPKFGKTSKRAYGVRKKLAQRIINTRNKLPEKQFQSLEQIDSIRGIGKDTMHDIITSIGKIIQPDPTDNTKLDDILDGITSALVNVKNQMDETSIEVVKRYKEKEIMSSLSLPFFSISSVELNLRFAVQKQSSKIGDTIVSVNPKYLRKIPKSMISEISLELNPQKNFKKKSFNQDTIKKGIRDDLSFKNQTTR